MSSTVSRAAEALGRAGALDLGLRLGLLALLLDSSLLWSERVPVIALAGLGLLVPGWLRARPIWIGLLAITSFSVLWTYPFADNHDYLTALFCLAVVCALHTPDPERSLATSARWLVGLSFAFAVLWKLGLADDFRDGRFFRVTFLTDTRFANLAILAGGLDWPRWEANDDLLSAVLSGRADFPEAGFDEPAALRRLAVAATVYTLLIETWVALSFLLPPGGRLARSRDLALLLFAVTTYPFATVRGFGWLLMVLGLSQCTGDRSRWRLAYVATFFLIEVYRSVPWLDALVEALGRGP